MKVSSHSDFVSTVTQAATANASANAQKASQGAVETAKSSGTSAGVSVSVSTLARSLEKPEATTSSDIDMAKVNAMKTAIQNGTFKVNPQAIADKLLSNAQEMLKGPANGA